MKKYLPCPEGLRDGEGKYRAGEYGKRPDTLPESVTDEDVCRYLQDRVLFFAEQSPATCRDYEAEFFAFYEATSHAVSGKNPYIKCLWSTYHFSYGKNSVRVLGAPRKILEAPLRKILSVKSSIDILATASRFRTREGAVFGKKMVAVCRIVAVSRATKPADLLAVANSAPRTKEAERALSRIARARRCDLELSWLGAVAAKNQGFVGLWQSLVSKVAEKSKAAP